MISIAYTIRRFLGLTSYYGTLIVGFNATAITSAALEINDRFGISDEHFPHSFWPVTSWGLGAALAPMVVLPIMEDFGMRIEYLVGCILTGNHFETDRNA